MVFYLEEKKKKLSMDTLEKSRPYRLQLKFSFLNRENEEIFLYDESFFSLI